MRPTQGQASRFATQQDQEVDEVIKFPDGWKIISDDVSQ